MSSRASPGKADAQRMPDGPYLHLQRLEARSGALCLRRAVLGRPRIRGRSNSGGQKLWKGDAERRSRKSATLHVRVRDAAPGKA